MDSFDISSVYKTGMDQDQNDGSDITYSMEFCDISSGGIDPGMTPYVLRKQDRQLPERVVHTTRFLERLNGMGILIEEVSSNGGRCRYKNIKHSKGCIYIRSLRSVRSIHMSDITGCKSWGKRLVIHIHDEEDVTIVTRCIMDSYELANFLG